MTTPNHDTATDNPRYPDIEVQLTGRDGSALRRAGVPQDEIDQYREESMSGDYDDLLRTAMTWVSVV